MRRAWFLLLTVGCSKPAAHPAGPPEPRLEPNVDSLVWYRSPVPCGQGPYEVAVDATGGKYGEDIELQLHAPHGVVLTAAVIDDDAAEIARASYGAVADNKACVADLHEQLVLGRASTTATPGTPVPTGHLETTTITTPTTPTTTAQLEIDPAPLDGVSVLHYRPPHAGRVRIRIWSTLPNDLAGVRFGVAHVHWRPNVGEVAYEAYLAQQAAAERERSRIAAERAARTPAVVVTTAPARAEVVIDYAARARAEAEAERRREIAAALELDRARRRKAFCDAHHDDRGCWGPGGYTLHAELEAKKLQRESYCMAHHESDARCWSESDRETRRAAWSERVAAARRAPRGPEGPPPAPLAETAPPRLSTHATWRPGYYQWTDGQWLWLAGTWRVPDEDIAKEDTTVAPAAPPAPRDETPPPPPTAATVVWLAGFWQWDGATWVWVPGSYQLRPRATVVWRAAEWRARGNVHVLIPGAWVHR